MTGHTKSALITGITGQDGSYLAELLLAKDYVVHGIKRRSSSFNTSRIDDLIGNPEFKDRLFLHYGDLSDSSSISNVVARISPDEIYNLRAQSHVAVSFELAEYTASVNGLGTLRLLEAMRQANIQDKCKFYQASTSELYGLVQESPQSERTPFYPRSPYAAAKLFAYWTVVNYREAYNIFACNGILFNHESPRRGETFVTQKIVKGLVRIVKGLQDELVLGNLDALRDWGHAKDYVRAQWMILQHSYPRDYVIASGSQSSVREFLVIAAGLLGMKLNFEGSGLSEVGILSEPFFNGSVRLPAGKKIIRVDSKYFRPSEVETLLGDATLAKNLLKWVPEYDLFSMCREMIDAELS